MVRVLALSSGDPGFKTRSDHSLNLFPVIPGLTSFPAALVNSQLVCLQPVGILNSCCCCCVSGEQSIEYIWYGIVLYCCYSTLQLCTGFIWKKSVTYGIRCEYVTYLSLITASRSNVKSPSTSSLFSKIMK